MYIIKLKTLFYSYPASLHQSFMLMMMSTKAFLPRMFCLLLIFILRFVIVIELPVSNLFSPDLRGCFLNKAKDLLEFV
jgi:hypothetical protein